jgi:hypothetical protein
VDRNILQKIARVRNIGKFELEESQDVGADDCDIAQHFQRGISTSR